VNIQEREVGSHWKNTDSFGLKSLHDRTSISLGEAFFFSVMRKKSLTPRVLHVKEVEQGETKTVKSFGGLNKWADVWMIGAQIDAEDYRGTHSFGFEGSFYMGLGQYGINNSDIEGYEIKEKGFYNESQIDLRAGLSYGKSWCLGIVQLQFDTALLGSMEGSFAHFDLVEKESGKLAYPEYSNIEMFWSWTAKASVLF
jgi:hypothetical protein